VVEVLLPEPITFLVHRAGDDGAMSDAEPGESPGAYLDDNPWSTIAAHTPTPLGHKVALRDLAAEKSATEYGETIGLARVVTMSEHIDLDGSGLRRLEYNLPGAGDRLGALIKRTVNGRVTCAEALGHREFALITLHPSA